MNGNLCKLHLELHWYPPRVLVNLGFISKNIFAIHPYAFVRRIQARYKPPYKRSCLRTFANMDRYSKDITVQNHSHSPWYHRGEVERLPDHESSFTEISLDSPSPGSLERGERADQAQRQVYCRRRNKILILAALVLVMIIGLGLGTAFLVKASRSRASGSSDSATDTQTTER